MEGGITRQVGAQHHRVDEETHHSLNFIVGAVGNRRADQQILLPTVAGQEGLKGGQQCHEQGGSLATAELSESLGELEGEAQGASGPSRGRDAWSRVIRGQGQGCWSSCQVLLPVSQLPLQHFPLQPVALPEGKVGILNGQVGQWRGLAERESRIEPGQFLKKKLERPLINHDVVHAQQQDMLHLAHVQQPRPQQGTTGQVKCLLSFLPEQVLDYCLPLVGA